MEGMSVSKLIGMKMVRKSQREIIKMADKMENGLSGIKMVSKSVQQISNTINQIISLLFVLKLMP